MILPTRQRVSLLPATGILILLAWVVLTLSLPSTRAWASSPPADRLARSTNLLLSGHLQDAIHDLNDLLAAEPAVSPSVSPSAGPAVGPAQLLLCRAYFAEGQIDPAITACEAAVHRMPRSSDAMDWLGRAYGRKADHASPLAGFQLARKVRDAFEAAVRLDPRSPAAADDLGEYYVNAPAVVGGGLDRANALSASLLPVLPQSAHRVAALAAEKRRDFPAAEREYFAAVDAARTPTDRAGALVDLALYYQTRRDPERAIQTVHRCLAADKDLGAPSVDAASILIDLNREPDLARRTLTDYLARGLKTDSAPAPGVYLLLSRLSLSAGDRARAKIELNQALQLAPDFEPAKRALQGL